MASVRLGIGTIAWCLGAFAAGLLITGLPVPDNPSCGFFEDCAIQGAVAVTGIVEYPFVSPAFRVAYWSATTLLLIALAGSLTVAFVGSSANNRLEDPRTKD